MNGKLDYPNAVEGGPGSWLVIDGREQVVAPNAVAVVPVTVSVPSGTTAGDHPAGLRIEDLSGNQGETTETPIFVKVAGSTGQRITVARAALDLDDGIRLPFQSRQVAMSFAVTNIGNTAVRGDLTVNVKTAFGVSGDGKTYRDIVLLPGGTLSGELSVAVPPMVTVTPTAVLEVPYVSPAYRNFSDSPVVDSYRLDASGAAETVIPWAEIITLCGVFVAAAAGWVLLRRRAVRRSASTTEPDAADAETVESEL